ncbi:MAG: SRPBCC domain-containing protein [Patescibacteria group bacterium]
MRTKKQQHRFTLTATFNASPAEVFDALTDSRKLAAWSGEGIVQPKVGGRFAMFDGWVSGKVLAYKPGKELGYTWKTTEWAEAWEPSEVRYTFAKTKTGTKVTLTHANLPNAKEAREHKVGWSEHVFEPLAEYFVNQ